MDDPSERMGASATAAATWSGSATSPRTTFTDAPAASSSAIFDRVGSPAPERPSKIKCRPPPDHPAGHQKSQPVQAAGDQIGPVFAEGHGLVLYAGAQGRRGREHDLADVPGLLHVPERRPGGSQVEDGPRQRLEPTRLEVGPKVIEHPGDQPRVVSSDLAEVDQSVEEIGPLPADLFGAPGIPPADLDQPTPLRQGLEARGDEARPGQGVQDDLHAGPPRVAQDLIGEEHVPGAVDVLDSQLSEEGLLAGAGRGEDLRAGPPGDLDGGLADPATRGMDQDPAPGPICRAGPGSNGR